MTLGTFTLGEAHEDAEKQFLKGLTRSQENPILPPLGTFTWPREKGKAIETYKKAVDVDSKNIPALSKVAEVYINEKKYEEASKEIEKILEVNPKSNEGTFLKGGCIWPRGNSMRRSTFFNRTSRSPEVADGHYYSAFPIWGTRMSSRPNPSWLKQSNSIRIGLSEVHSGRSPLGTGAFDLRSKRPGRF